MKKKTLLAVMAIALIACMTLLAACGSSQAQPKLTAEDAAQAGSQLAAGGTLTLKVNPEIDICYDAEGKVTAVKACNPEAREILSQLSGLEGRDCSQVAVELVNAIGEAGYFVEEIDGGARHITIELERGSVLPSEEFMDHIVAQIQICVENNQWNSPVEVQGMTDYSDYIPEESLTEVPGMTDYTDYTEGRPAEPQPTEPGATDYTDYGVTDYNDTDYGPNGDGVTDYNDTDYGPNGDGVTDYNDTDYGPNGDGVTDYTDYRPSAPAPTEPQPTEPAETDYTDYQDTDYGATDYDDTDYGTDYNDTDYDD